MLVVEPERRYTLKQIIKHRWLSDWVVEVENQCRQLIQPYVTQSNSLMQNTGSNIYNMATSYKSNSQATSVPNLDSVVMSHMLQLPGLTADKIAQSVHENRFDNIYAVYYLLYDKLQEKRKECQKIQQHTSRSR